MQKLSGHDPRELEPVENPGWSGFILKNCSPCEGTVVEPFVKDCRLWECCPKRGLFYQVCNKPMLTHSGEILFYSGLGAQWTFHKSSTPKAGLFVTFIH